MVTEILQFTDLHLPPEAGARVWGIDPMARLQAALEDAAREHPRARLAVFSGDLVHEPNGSGYERLDRLLARQPWPCWALPGNHDDPTQMQARLPHAPFVRRGALGHWRIHLLDSRLPGESAGHLASSALDALREALLREPQAPALVFLHHHALAVDSPWLDAIMLRNATALERVVAASKSVRAVLWGHTHQRFTGMLGATPAFGTPSTAMQFRPRSAGFATQDRGAGYRWLRLHADGTLETGVRYVPSGTDGR